MERNGSRVLEIEFLAGAVKKMRIPQIQEKEELTPKIFAFNVSMMNWYHARVLHTDISALDLLSMFPSYPIRLEGFTILVESGGEKYPETLCLSIFNPNDVVVDEINFMYPELSRKLPEKWPHGAWVADGSRSLGYTPEICYPYLKFSQGSFRVLVYDRMQEWVRDQEADKTWGFALMVYNQDDVPVFARRYLYSTLSQEEDRFAPLFRDGTPIVDSRKPMDYIPPDSMHPKFFPPE